MKPSRSFASDNNAGVHPEVLKAIAVANQGHVVGYGDDPYTESAARRFKRYFGDDIAVFFVFNGTAANCLGLNLRQATGDLGVDVLSFGATKNGGMGAEAVVFFDSKLASDFKFYRKQGMQLASKMRYLSAQFEALLQDGLWLRNAQHANRMAQVLKQELSKIQQVKLAYKVEANGVFVKVPRKVIAKLQKRYFFYMWDEAQSMVRWMCSWDTTEADVKQFAEFVRRSL